MGGLSGGGIYNSGAIININNSTISNNTTLGSGGGIFCVNNSTTNIYNTIISSNLGQSIIYDDGCDIELINSEVSK